MSAGDKRKPEESEDDCVEKHRKEEEEEEDEEVYTDPLEKALALLPENKREAEKERLSSLEIEYDQASEKLCDALDESKRAKVEFDLAKLLLQLDTGVIPYITCKGMVPWSLDTTKYTTEKSVAVVYATVTEDCCDWKDFEMAKDGDSDEEVDYYGLCGELEETKLGDFTFVQHVQNLSRPAAVGKLDVTRIYLKERKSKMIRLDPKITVERFLALGPRLKMEKPFADDLKIWLKEGKTRFWPAALGGEIFYSPTNKDENPIPFSAIMAHAYLEKAPGK